MSAPKNSWDWRAAYDSLIWKLPLISRFTRREYESISLILDQLQLEQNSTILHIACGSKASAIPLQYSQVLHCDMSLAMLKQSRRTSSAISCGVADVQMLPIKSGSVDVIIAVGLTEYLENPTLWLQECYRVLKPEARLLFSISQPNWKNRVRYLWSKQLFLRDSNQWNQWITANGFQILGQTQLPIQIQFACQKK